MGKIVLGESDQLLVLLPHLPLIHHLPKALLIILQLMFSIDIFCFRHAYLPLD